MAIAAGCSGSGEEPTTISTASEGTPDGVTFVGKVDASSANIGLVTQGDRLAGMVCQGLGAALRLDAVTVANGSAELTSDGNVVGIVSVADNVAVGTVELDGSKHKFMAEPATGGAGVFRLAAESPDDAWDGWVVLNDGSHTGTSEGKPSTGSLWIDPDQEP
jgi:hypothetical protein